MLTIEASNINEMKLKQTKTDKFTKALKMELASESKLKQTFKTKHRNMDRWYGISLCVMDLVHLWYDYK